MQQNPTMGSLPRRRKIGKEFHLSLLFMLFAFWALIIFRDFFGIGIPRILFTGLAALGFFFLPLGEEYALFFAMLPFTSNLNFNEISLLFFASYILRRLNVKLPRAVLYLAAILFIELYNVFYAGGDIRLFLQFSTVFLCGTLLLVTPLKKETVLKIIQSFIVSAMLAGWSVFYNTFTRISMEDFFSWGYRLGRMGNYIEGAATSFDPNELSVFLILAFSLLAMLYYIRRVSLGVFVSFSAAFIFLYAYTQSRGGLLMLGAFLILFWIGQLRNPKLFLYYGLILIAAVLVVAILFSGPLSGLYERFIYRFEEADATGGRADLWETILTKQIEDPVRFFIGFGSRAYAQIIDNVTAHNTFLDIYASWGLVGIFLMLFWHLFVFSHLKKQISGKIPFVYYAPFLAIMVAAMGLQFYLVVYLSILLGLSELSLRLAEFDEDTTKTYRQVHLREKRLRKEAKNASLEVSE